MEKEEKRERESEKENELYPPQIQTKNFNDCHTSYPAREESNQGCFLCA